MLSTSYQDLAAEKRAQQFALIPAEWRLDPIPSVDSAPNALAYIRENLTRDELALTEETDITVLLRKLSSGELSSLALTKAFSKRAAIAHQLTVCCTEVFFEEALAVAKEMDNHLARTGKTVGPLHGLPVSIKDLFSVKGQDTSIGTKALPFHSRQNLTYTNRMGRLNRQSSPSGQIRRKDSPPSRRRALREDQSPPIHDDVRLIQPCLRPMRPPI